MAVTTRPPPHPVGPIPRFRELTPEARQATLDATLADRPPGQPLWVFAYGSLMWRPCFRHREQRLARLPGYHRDYTIWTVIGRGSPDYPGLGLALDHLDDPGHPGCPGIAFRLDETPGVIEPDLAALWDREMLTGIYAPQWLPLRTAQGPLSAIAFVVRRDHDQYAGQIALEDRAAIIAWACGKFGPCADYLARTVEALAEAGAPDAELEALLERVEGILALHRD